MRSTNSTGFVQIPRTGQTTSYAVGDDGLLQRGVAWPNPRFTDNGNDTVTDNLTGLMWTSDANAPGPSSCSPGISKKWQDALDYVVCLNTSKFLGYSDWRLPNLNELQSLIDRSQLGPALPADNPFTNIQSSFTSSDYWSSSFDMSWGGANNYAWNVHMYDGMSMTFTVSFYSYYVWPVRGGNIICTTPLSVTDNRLSYKVSPGSFNVKTSSNICAWTATSDSDWLVITGNSNGTGSGKLNYSVTANTSKETRTGHITIDDKTFTVTQAGGSPKISATPASINFGNVKSGITTTAKTVTIKNTGTAYLEVSSIVISGTNASDFSQTNSCTIIAPNALCNIAVQMTPTSYNNKSATLSITSNGSIKPISIKLVGVALPPVISVPASLAFSATNSASKVVTIKNIGLSSLLVADVTITGANSPDFSFTKDCSLELAKNETCRVTITFTPTSKGKKSATLNISSNDPKKAIATVKLSGMRK